MRCPDCNKFVGFEENDPEIENLEVNEDGQVNASVRIVNSCAECSNELKEATFDLEWEPPDGVFDGHAGEGHELNVEENSSERTSRSGYFKKGVFVPAYGRYAKTFYGAEVEFSITCSCGKLELVTGSMTDDVQASGMDELV